MPLYAVRTNEKMAYTIDDATLYYRRLSLIERQQIDARHSTNGLRDVSAVLLDILEACVVGWSGYACPLTGDAIPFDPSNAATHREAIAALPTEVQTTVGTLCQSAIAQRAADLGNSTAGSSANSQSVTLSQLHGGGFH